MSDGDGKRGIDRLLEVCDRLRDPGGCPWDRKQTRQTLRQYVLEEAYEVVDAIDAGESGGLREELGDLLFPVVFHAKLGKEEGAFDFEDVAAGCADKLIRRHPHVFEDRENAKDADEAFRRWEEIKAEERRAKATAAGDAAGAEKIRGALEGLPVSMPALMRAHRIQEKAARTGFDWESIDGVWEKLDEEVGELKEAAASGDPARIEHELGDLLFTAVNLARFLGTTGEDALRRGIDRFSERFGRVETKAREGGRTLKGMTLAELEALWQEAKRAEGRED